MVTKPNGTIPLSIQTLLAPKIVGLTVDSVTHERPVMA